MELVPGGIVRDVFIVRWLRVNQNHDKLLSLNRYFPQSEESMRCTCGNVLHCTLAADLTMCLNCNAIHFELIFQRRKCVSNPKWL